MITLSKGKRVLFTNFFSCSIPCKLCIHNLHGLHRLQGLQGIQGEQGPKTDIVLLNAGAAIHIAKGCSIEEGIAIARDAIDSGKAYKQLEKFIELSNK